MAIPRALGGTSPSTRSPPMWISPDVGRSSPAIIRSSVVLPEPEEPSRTRNSPSRIERSTPSTAWSSAKCFLRFRISTPATVGPLPPRLAGVGRRIRLLRQVHRRGGDDVVRARRGPGGAQHLPRRARRPPPPAPGAGARRETLLLQPGLELVRRGVGGDGLLEQPSLDREADCVGGRIALAPLAPPLRRLQGGEELAADCARAGQWAVAHAPPFRTPNANPSRGRRRSAIRASSAYPGRSGR